MELNHHTEKSKTLTYFKYQMKDTNQLLKDVISCGQTLSRSEQKNHQNPKQISLREVIANQKLGHSLLIKPSKRTSEENFDNREENHQNLLQNLLKFQADFNDEDSEIQKVQTHGPPQNRKRKLFEKSSMEGLILRKLYFDSEQNEQNDQNEEGSSRPIQKYKNRESNYCNISKFSDPFEMRKERKGLANISLKVKRIVTEHSKLTYKQVSDFVLQYSHQQIDRMELAQKSKQIKNIKRRVYDALNVLVAVGILGKNQRCVCVTEWTSVIGKKHSTQWQKVNDKLEHLNKLKKSCAQKAAALNLLIQKYNAVAALRNKHKKEEFDKKKTFDNVGFLVIQEAKNLKEKQSLKLKNCETTLETDQKLYFPIVVFCPAFTKDIKQKLIVEMEISSQEDEQKKLIAKREKVKISGKNITILGDFDCALNLNLEVYRVKQQEKSLIEEIQNYADEYFQNSNPQQKPEILKYCEANIEDYFNDQMFQLK